ncbi:MAG TPA: hypothetical protein ENF48_12060 [Desulfobacteraceae bacterium]|nr:hypothetical protein [Desulfobacteraceae bacterium]
MRRPWRGKPGRRDDPASRLIKSKLPPAAGGGVFLAVAPAEGARSFFSMATEEGIVTKVDGALAEVRTVKSEACAACSAKEFCHDGGREMTVSVLNHAKARPGDRVRLEIATGAFVKVMFLLYIIPILALLAGALVGLALSGDKAAVLGALVGFAIAVAFVRVKGRRMGNMAAYQPRIVRVLERCTAVDINQPAA